MGEGIPPLAVAALGVHCGHPARRRLRLDVRDLVPTTFGLQDQGQAVRLSEDYFIEARKANPPEVSIARPGGDYRVNITGHERVSGEVIEIVPDRRLVFTWGWEGGALPVAPGESTVEISLEPDGQGTLLRLTHRDLPRDMHTFHRLGWDYALPRLAAVAAGRDPGPDPLRSILRGTLMITRSLPPRYLFQYGRRRLRRS